MADELLGYVMVMSQNVHGGRGLNVQFNMPSDADEKAWNKQLDLLSNVFDRQSARAELPGLREQLIVKQRVADTIRNDIKKLDLTIDLKQKNSDLRDKSATQEVAAAANQRESLKKIEKEIEDFKGIIKDLEKKAA